MSVPSPYTQRGTTGEATEDCRDYLRTGRCKYGASCKYNHPPNVQSGGGMKAPVDPSEPMFPVRPNEPVCQYYMKHGTCKFGQACKFHHPPQSTVTAALVGGGAMVMNMGRKNDVPQIVMPGDGSGGTPMMLQFLPQRPDEQDCIFFLKNGRCKYGATCRYHHPISFSGQRRPDDGRRRVQVQQVPDGFLQHPNVQFINQSGSQHYQQGPPSSSGGTHMVVTDAPVTYMTLDGSKGSYHQLSVVSKDGYCAPTGAPISQNQDHTSSTSSIASSYDTAASTFDHMNSHSEQQQQSSGLWNRQKNNGSHASLNAYDASGARPRMPMPQNTSDGSLSRRNRAASYGSANDGGAFVDANGNVTGRGGGGAQIPSSAWSECTPSYDNVRRGPPNQYQDQQQVGKGRRLPQGGRGRHEAVDYGLHKMTESLLTLLDTPEEAAADGYEYDYEEMEQRARGQLPPNRFQMMNQMNQNVAVAQRPPDVARATSDGQVYDQRLDRDFFGGMPINSPTMDGRYQDPHHINAEESSNWLPNWDTPNSVGRSLEGDAQSMSVIQPRHAPNSPQPSSNVGLFLP